MSSNYANKLSHYIKIYKNPKSNEKQNYIDNIKSEKICQECKIFKLINYTSLTYFCPNCGNSNDITYEFEKNYTKNNNQCTTIYPYKRINHFSEILNQMQAKENTHIPNHIYNSILSELKKRKIFNYENISLDDLNKILKKLHCDNKYREHRFYIINKLNNFQPIIISKTVEEEFKHMFKKIQIPYEKYKSTKRKNFLNYYYVLNKFCHIKKIYDLLPYCKLPKNKDKIDEQDKIFRKICKDLNWNFVSSR